MKWFVDNIFLILIIIVFIIISAGSAWQESLTYDEPVYLQIGLEAYQGKFSTDPYNPPFLAELSSIPILLGLGLPRTLPAEIYFPARMITVFLGAGLIYAVYYAGRKYFSRRVANFAVILAAFEPTILGHSHYVTYDTGTTLAIFTAFLALSHLMINPSHRNFLKAGLFTGLAFACRIVTIPYILASGILLGIYLHPRDKSSEWRWTGWIVALATAALVIWMTFSFRPGVIISPEVRSGRLSQKITIYARDHHLPFISSTLEFLQTQPLPLGQYAALLKNNILRGINNTSWWFSGEFRQNFRWYFMPVTIFMKTPLPLIILFILGILRILTQKNNSGQKQFLIPICVIIGLSLFLRTSPLMRYMMPVFPYVILVAAVGATTLAGRLGKMIVTVLIIWQIGSVMQYYPHLIAYANEYAGPRQKRYEIFTDSNLDWGQGLKSLYRYLGAKQPGEIEFSYFGQDDASAYGFESVTNYFSWITADVCAFHPVKYPQWSGKPLTVISVSNWHRCGYNQVPDYSDAKIKDFVADAFLIF